MGTALKRKGEFELATECYNHALKINPNHADCEKNLIEILTIFIPQKKIISPIIQANEAIREISISYQNEAPFPDSKIAKLYIESSNILTDNNIEIDYPLSQVYRRNTNNLNCKRHKEIFNKNNVIPKFCFGCYKVQIEPKTVVDFLNYS
jgi:tetratricopeptide (TPR) repeat protein